ncbi:four-helix bundle copper-binding protein [Parapedobacter sp. GCM10030251]
MAYSLNVGTSKQMDHCRACAEACRRCGEASRQMAAA